MLWSSLRIFRSSRRASRRSGLPPRKRRSTDTVIVRMPHAPERSGPQRSASGRPHRPTIRRPSLRRQREQAELVQHSRSHVGVPFVISGRSPEPLRTSRTRRSGARTPRRATTDRPPRRKSALRVRAFPYGGNTAGSGRRCRSLRTLAAATGDDPFAEGMPTFAGELRGRQPRPVEHRHARIVPPARRASSSQKSRTPTCTSDARDGASRSALNIIEACERTKPS